ncbi:two-component system response regulator [Fulvivirga imtechensis AK7]|uniref:Two-component system response regulator n=2 Tax=Fulvivirga TaxID=396811 RepID=L8JJV8_9BACT|nr:two-component system response regulator [Fulvivirga imtechensis AK7]
MGTDQYGILFIDYRQLPGFDIEQFSLLSARNPELKIAVVSDDNDHKSILQVLNQGVSVFITKNCGLQEITMAYHAMQRGEKFFCNKILNILLQLRTPEQAIKNSVLTERELEVLKLIAIGYSTLEVADQLYLSPHTVSTHRKNIIKKLTIKSPTEFVVHAIDLGLVNFDAKC